MIKYTRNAAANVLLVLWFAAMATLDQFNAPEYASWIGLALFVYGLHKIYSAHSLYYDYWGGAKFVLMVFVPLHVFIIPVIWYYAFGLTDQNTFNYYPAFLTVRTLVTLYLAVYFLDFFNERILKKHYLSARKTTDK